MLPLSLPLGSNEVTVIVKGTGVEENEKGTVDSTDSTGTDVAQFVGGFVLLWFPENVGVVVVVDVVLSGCCVKETDVVDLAVKAKPTSCVLLIALTFELFKWLSSDLSKADEVLSSSCCKTSKSTAKNKNKA